MKATVRPPIVVGRTSRVEIASDGSAMVLWVAGVSVRLERSVAKDVTASLIHALARCSPPVPVSAATDSDDDEPAEADEWDIPTLPEPFAPSSH